MSMMSAQQDYKIYFFGQVNIGNCSTLAFIVNIVPTFSYEQVSP